MNGKVDHNDLIFIKYYQAIQACHQTFEKGVQVTCECTAASGSELSNKKNVKKYISQEKEGSTNPAQQPCHFQSPCVTLCQDTITHIYNVNAALYTVYRDKIYR